MKAYIKIIRKRRKHQPKQKDQKMSNVKYKEVKTKTKVYNVREKYADLPSVSAIIRAMAKDGFSRWDIHKDTGIRYQHVRNVLITPLAK